MLANLTYSRELETEADSKGMDVLRSNGISLKGFVDLFKLLKNEHGDVGSLKLLSTHPLTEERLRAAADALREQSVVGRNGDLEAKWETIRGNSR